MNLGGDGIVYNQYEEMGERKRAIRREKQEEK